MNKYCLFTAILLLGTVQPISANTLGGVFGPSIKADDRSLQWRTSISPEEDGGRDHFAGRLHYQHSFNDRYRARFWVAFNDVENGDLEYKFFQAEFHWQLKKPDATSTWGSAIRFDARFTDGDEGTDLLGFVWTNQWTPQEKLILTHAFFPAIQVGDQSKSGVLLETRSAVDYVLDNGMKVGVHSFNTFGNSKSLGSFDNQNHRLGPAISGKLSGTTSFFIGPLFGVSDGARDVDIRLWVTKKY